MTAEATKAPPARRKRLSTVSDQSRTRTQKAVEELEAELRRWSPEEVVEKKLLPYKSARSLKEKCYRREVHCHLDGGIVSFTADDIRAENARTAVAPAA
ncbi:hypothetical protein [Streptomyces sp. NPDC051994]|uniref:hypothetical protein n=1 Tax=unclassified Streptomyces TaxID=2593676 RepID=UPI00343070EB